MKRWIFPAALLLLAIPAQAQDDSTRHGPVVYPATTNATPALAATLTNSEAAGDLRAPASQDSAAQSPTTNTIPSPAPLQPSIPPAPAISAPPVSAPALNVPFTPPQMATTPGSGAPKEDIYDIRPPFFYLHSWFWLWIALGALALIALIILLWKWLKPLRALHPKTAYDLTLEKLEKARALLDEKNPEPYAVLVSETIRSYLSQRFQTPSTRRTTEEFLRQMQADTTTPLAEHRDLLRGFLEACDLVKFAHYQPERAELEQVHERAVTFVTATKPAEQNGRHP